MIRENYYMKNYEKCLQYMIDFMNTIQTEKKESLKK